MKLIFFLLTWTKLYILNELSGFKDRSATISTIWTNHSLVLFWTTYTCSHHVSTSEPKPSFYFCFTINMELWLWQEEEIGFSRSRNRQLRGPYGVPNPLLPCVILHGVFCFFFFSINTVLIILFLCDTWHVPNLCLQTNGRSEVSRKNGVKAVLSLLSFLTRPVAKIFPKLSKTLTLEPRPSQYCDFIIDSIWKWYLLQWLGLLGWCVDKLKYVDFTSSFCEDFKFDPTLKPLFIPTRFPPQPYLTPSLIPVFRVSWREDWSTSLSNKQTSSTRNHFSSASTDSKAPEPWQNKEKRRSICSGMFPMLWSLKPLSVFFFLKSF